jgi:hypothetical protein
VLNVVYIRITHPVSGLTPVNFQFDVARCLTDRFDTAVNFNL